MKIIAESPENYILQLPEDRQIVMNKLRNLLKEKLPKGFEESMSSGMISFVIPHSIYPAGYHCTPTDPLPFISIASQKNFVALYHMGLYADPKLTEWFVNAYKIRVGRKVDMGKSCVRFKNISKIPYNLIAELFEKISVEQWIATYEANFKK